MGKREVLTSIVLCGITLGVSQGRSLSGAQVRLSRADYQDRVKAAWTGQIIGALLGLPFEHKPAAVTWVDHFAPGEISRRGGKDYYAAPVDDDYYYEIIALRAFEKYGPGLTVQDLGRQWVENSAGAFGSSQQTRLLLERGILPPDTGHPHYNPLWFTIGPEFSSDIYGMFAPGMPNVAASLAREMGRINGYAEAVDGAVFVAGMISSAFVENDPRVVVRNAARLIDPRSPYRQCLDLVIGMAGQGHSPAEIADAVEQRYRVEYPATNNAVANGGIVALSVWFGAGDFLKTINTAISAADFSDADCNAANAGAVIGALRGTKNLPPGLVSQIGDRIQGDRLGVALTPPVDESVAALAHRTVAIGEVVLTKNRGRVDGQSLLIPTTPIRTQPGELFQLSDLMKYWNSEWRLERAGFGGNSGGWGDTLGRTYLDGDVLVTSPRDRVLGVVLTRTAVLGTDPHLKLEVGANPGRAWQLLVYVNNELALTRIIEGTSEQRHFVLLDVGLKEYAGQKVVLRLYQTQLVGNRIAGEACWRSIRLE